MQEVWEADKVVSRITLLKKSPIQLFILPLLSLVGVGASVALTQHFYKIKSGLEGFKSFCNVTQTLNCDVVAASPYAKLFGLPLSNFAAAWFVVLFIVTLIAHKPYWRREALRISLGITFLGSAVSLAYLAVMAVQLKTYCLLCLAVDGVNLTAFLLVLSLKPEGFSKHKLDPPKWKVMLSSGGVASAFALWGLTTLDTASAIQPNDLKELVDSVLSTPIVAVNTGSEFPSIGSPSAKITVVEFSDFQCPFCRLGAFAVNSVVNRYPNQIRVVFRNYPLDMACNPQFETTTHPIACEAAHVAVCAQKYGKFEPIYQNLFEKQASFSPGRPLEIAADLGLDRAELRTCMDSQETSAALSKDIREATVLGVKSTPTFFINGHKMEGAYPVEAWDKIVDSLLNH